MPWEMWKRARHVVPALLRTAWAIIRFDRRVIAAISADRPVGRALAFVVVPAIVGTVYTVAITYYQLWAGLVVFGAEDSIGPIMLHTLPTLLVSVPIALFMQLTLIAGVLRGLSRGVPVRSGLRIAAYASLFHCAGILGVVPWIAFVYACIRARVGDDGHPAALAFAATAVLIGLGIIEFLLRP